MSPSHVLDQIKKLVAKGFIRFTSHARQRMDDRDASEADISNALLTATTADYQNDRANYRVSGGADLDGEPMTVIVAVEADVIVVTMF